jgi:L-lactate dehydrogenase complex protein LldF
MNTCPVYRRSGGHSYQYAIAGPIGSILAPALDMKQHADLPFASTLCGSCTHVCPVKIDIHNQLYKWRQVIVKEGYVSGGKKKGFQLLAKVLSSPRLFRQSGKIGRWMMKIFPQLFKGEYNAWSRQREMPVPPQRSFREWYVKNRKQS